MKICYQTSYNKKLQNLNKRQRFIVKKHHHKILINLYQKKDTKNNYKDNNQKYNGEISPKNIKNYNKIKNDSTNKINKVCLISKIFKRKLHN